MELRDPHPHKKPPAPVFLALAIVIFFLALSAADSIGFVPYYIDGTSPAGATEVTGQPTDEHVVTDLAELSADSLMLDSEGHLLPPRATLATQTAGSELPVHLTIEKIGLDLSVQNPSTIEVNALDALLVNGPARYRDSAKLGEPGNMILFAHSSHLPIVHNQMYKAFNRIPELAAGDTITLMGEHGTQYLYRVNTVKQADVNDNVEISLAKNATKLTLVTCDTLTGKSARYVLDADFIGTVGN